MKRSVLFIALLIAFHGVLAGCAMKQAVSDATPPPPVIDAAGTLPQPSAANGLSGGKGVPATGVKEEIVPEAPRLPAEPVALQQTVDTAALAAGLRSIPFEYDQHLLTEAAMEILAANADFLKSRPALRVRIEGHCDERGSDQYNIALGERRADAVRNYLLSLGIAEQRLDTVSYGEEKPLDPGHDESAWVKNRRAEFVPLP